MLFSCYNSSSASISCLYYHVHSRVSEWLLLVEPHQWSFLSYQLAIIGARRFYTVLVQVRSESLSCNLSKFGQRFFQRLPTLKSGYCHIFVVSVIIITNTIRHRSTHYKPSSNLLVSYRSLVLSLNTFSSTRKTLVLIESRIGDKHIWNYQCGTAALFSFLGVDSTPPLCPSHI